MSREEKERKRTQKSKKSKKSKDTSLARLHKLLKEHRPELLEEYVEDPEIEFWMEKLFPSERKQRIDYSQEQNIAQGGKVLANSTRKANYKAG